MGGRRYSHEARIGRLAAAHPGVTVGQRVHPSRTLVSLFCEMRAVLSVLFLFVVSLKVATLCVLRRVLIPL